MRVTYEAETGTCPSNCKGDYIPCPHDTFDADDWCTECLTPADEVNPKISCQDSWHD